MYERSFLLTKRKLVLASRLNGCAVLACPGLGFSTYLPFSTHNTCFRFKYGLGLVSVRLSTEDRLDEQFPLRRLNTEGRLHAKVF